MITSQYVAIASYSSYMVKHFAIIVRIKAAKIGLSGENNIHFRFFMHSFERLLNFHLLNFVVETFRQNFLSPKFCITMALDFFL